MRRKWKSLGAAVCVLALLACGCPWVAAAEELKSYDCFVSVLGANSVPEKVSGGYGVQIRAGDGSGDAWAVAEYDSVVTDDATQFIVFNPYDGKQSTIATLIAGDSESGIAVFRLEKELTSRLALPMRTLDGLKQGDTLRVAGAKKNEDGKITCGYGPAVIKGMTDRNGYSLVELTDSGDYNLVDAAYLPIGLVIDVVSNEAVGFYCGDYQCFPAGYILTGADGIGSLGGGEPEQPAGGGSKPPDTPAGGGGGTPEAPKGGGQGQYNLETIQSDTGMAEILARANAEKARAKTMRIVMIAAAVVIAAGIVAFALLRGKKGSGRPTRVNESGPDRRTHTETRAQRPPQSEPQPMGKTEYVGTQSYGGTEPAAPEFRLTPLPGTPGAPRSVPPQGLTFGRSPECDVLFPMDAGGVSGRHCALAPDGGRLVLTDLGSSYGTLLEDGRRLSKDETAVLKPGDRFYLGSRKIGFQITEQ